MSEEIKPCPFCGSDHQGRVGHRKPRSEWRVHKDTILLPGIGDWNVVVCENCAAMAPVEIWNDRAGGG